jgi:hypothetical protein
MFFQSYEADAMAVEGEHQTSMMVLMNAEVKQLCSYWFDFLTTGKSN